MQWNLLLQLSARMNLSVSTSKGSSFSFSTLKYGSMSKPVISSDRQTTEILTFRNAFEDTKKL